MDRPTPVVYFVKPGDDNEELRYSLRSLENIEHGDVWIVGYKPAWVVNVGYLPVPAPKTRIHWTQVVVAFTKACDSREIPDEFALFNDDFFALAPTGIPLWHKGPADETLTRHKGPATNWKTGFAATVRLLESWGVDPVFDYEIHVPMMVEKRAMAEALAKAAPYEIPALQRRTLYGALFQVGGVEHEDVAIGSRQETPKPGQKWAATNDSSFQDGAVGAHIRSLFPDPSPYEEA